MRHFTPTQVRLRQACVVKLAVHYIAESFHRSNTPYSADLLTDAEMGRALAQAMHALLGPDREALEQRGDDAFWSVRTHASQAMSADPGGRWSRSPERAFQKRLDQVMPAPAGEADPRRWQLQRLAPFLDDVVAMNLLRQTPPGDAEDASQKRRLDQMLNEALDAYQHAQRAGLLNAQGLPDAPQGDRQAPAPADGVPLDASVDLAAQLESRLDELLLGVVGDDDAPEQVQIVPFRVLEVFSHRQGDVRELMSDPQILGRIKMEACRHALSLAGGNAAPVTQDRLAEGLAIAREREIATQPNQVPVAVSRQVGQVLGMVLDPGRDPARGGADPAHDRPRDRGVNMRVADLAQAHRAKCSAAVADPAARAELEQYVWGLVKISHPAGSAPPLSSVVDAMQQAMDLQPLLDEDEVEEPAVEAPADPVLDADLDVEQAPPQAGDLPDPGEGYIII